MSFSLKTKSSDIFQCNLPVYGGYSHHQAGVFNCTRGGDKLSKDNFAELIQAEVESQLRWLKFSLFTRKSFVDSIVKPNFEDAEIIESYLFKYYITGQQVKG